MAPIGGPTGGGQSGFGSGGSFTGPAEALEIIGNHAYAYSGLISASTTTKTYLNFTSGNYYFVGQFQFNSPLEEDDPQPGVEAVCKISFNSVGIAIIRAGGDFADNADSVVNQELIIPPYTEMNVVVDCHNTDAARLGSCTLVGRIFRD